MLNTELENLLKGLILLSMQTSPKPYVEGDMIVVEIDNDLQPNEAAFMKAYGWFYSNESRTWRKEV